MLIFKCLLILYTKTIISRTALRSLTLFYVQESFTNINLHIEIFLFSITDIFQNKL